MIFFYHKFTFHHSRINENLAIEPAIKSEKIEDNDKMILNKVLKISWLNANKAKKKKKKVNKIDLIEAMQNNKIYGKKHDDLRLFFNS